MRYFLLLLSIVLAQTFSFGQTLEKELDLSRIETAEGSLFWNQPFIGFIIIKQWKIPLCAGS